MTLSIQECPYALFGINADKPALPTGWRYVERPDRFLIAQSPDGEYWYAGKTHLAKLRFASNWDVIRSQVRSWFNEWITPFEEGDNYADTNWIIPMP